MIDKLKYVVLLAAACAAALYLSYRWGYSIAETKGVLAIETLKKENAQEVIKAQTLAKEKYEKQIKDLVNARAAERLHYAERLREFEHFRGASTDLAACRRDRSRLARVAIGFENLTTRAINDLKTTVKYRKN